MYIIKGMKIRSNPKGFNNIKLKMERVIVNGFSENSIIRKYKKAAIPKIIKRKSALITHKRIKTKKIKSIES
ncbi:MAG: hypothetical protein ACFFCY_01840 [Promethearchaeota archaeon]